MKHKDFFGKPLSVGDTVAFIAPGYRHLVKGTITSLTPKKVRLSYSNTWNYSRGYPCEIIQSPEQLVYVESEPAEMLPS